nr:DUF2332 family protein [Mesorhizobium sp.]
MPTLLPVLARLPQPLALLEVGTSAGLCLMPDLYSYDYGRTVLRAPDMASEPPIFRCSASETTPLPTAPPHVVWRAGLDLSPNDASDASQVAWLETLVWPEQRARLANLRAALKIAATVKPRVVKGDLRGSDLVRLCSEAPKDATLVVFHPAVLDYVSDPADREAFAEQVMRLSVLGIERVPSRIPVRCHTRRKKPAARPLPPICERLPCRLDRPAWRLARMDRGRGVGGWQSQRLQTARQRSAIGSSRCAKRSFEGAP